MGTFSGEGGDALIRVRVTPRSGREELSLGEQGEIRVRLTSPPVKGAANRALIKLLARCLEIGKRDVEIVSGEGSRRKTVRVRGLSTAQVRDRLHRAASS